MQPDDSYRTKLNKKQEHFHFAIRKNVIYLALGILAFMLIIYFVYRVILQYPIQNQAKVLLNPERSIVVLPFKNMSNDTDNQYLADGIMENIINELFSTGKMNIISRSTSEHFSGNLTTSFDIAKQLNVNYVLEGNVHRDNDRIKIIVELYDVLSNKYILSEKYEDELGNIFAVQSDIIRKISDKLGVILSYEDILQIEKVPTITSDAYDSYLKARFLFHKAINEQQVSIDKETLAKSRQYYEKAVASDTSFADAYAGLANVWFTSLNWDWIQSSGDSISKAREYSEKALKIDPYSAEAHAVKGSYLIWPLRMYEKGRMELLVSLQLNPNYPVVDYEYAQLLMITGPMERARQYINDALKREPYLWALQNLSSWTYYFEGKYKESIEACIITSELNPGYIFTEWLLFFNYLRLGEGDKAAAELQTILLISTRSEKYGFEIMNIFKQSDINGLLTWLIDYNIKRPFPVAGLNGQPFFISWYYAIMGNGEKSLSWLEKSMASNIPNYAFSDLIATNPDFDILREDPRFLDIIKKMCLTPYNTRKARQNK